MLSSTKVGYPRRSSHSIDSRQTVHGSLFDWTPNAERFQVCAEGEQFYDVGRVHGPLLNEAVGDSTLLGKSSIQKFTLFRGSVGVVHLAMFNGCAGGDL